MPPIAWFQAALHGSARCSAVGVLCPPGGLWDWTTGAAGDTLPRDGCVQEPFDIHGCTSSHLSPPTAFPEPQEHWEVISG